MGDNTSLVLSIMSLPVPAGVQGTDQPPPSTPSHGSGRSRGCGGAGTVSRPVLLDDLTRRSRDAGD